MIISNKYIKNGLEWTGKCIHSPEQRLILGATALATQPFIDLHNKKVDEETRKTSVARTIAKIIAGTITGVAVRHACISLVEKNCVYKIKNNIIQSVKGKSFFVPKNINKIIKEEKLSDVAINKRFNKYIKGMGTFIATIAMIGTNFLIDAPFTRYLTDKFLEKTKTKEVAKK